MQVFRRRESSELVPGKGPLALLYHRSCKEAQGQQLAAVSKDRKEGGWLHTHRRVY